MSERNLTDWGKNCIATGWACGAYAPAGQHDNACKHCGHLRDCHESARKVAYGEAQRRMNEAVEKAVRDGK